MTPFIKPITKTEYRMQMTQLTTKRLLAEGIPFREPVDFHIKAGRVNFYPSTGKVFVDGEKAARPERGIDAFISVAKKEY